MNHFKERKVNHKGNEDRKGPQKSCMIWNVENQFSEFCFFNFSVIPILTSVFLSKRCVPEMPRMCLPKMSTFLILCFMVPGLSFFFSRFPSWPWHMLHYQPRVRKERREGFSLQEFRKRHMKIRNRINRDMRQEKNESKKEMKGDSTMSCF
jgi:hypothetical protein